MTFINIKADTDCNCFDTAFIDNDRLYARKVGKQSTPKLRDFKSYWDSGKRLDNLNDCDQVCRYKGISVNPWNESTKEFVENLYIDSCRIAPGRKKKICVFKLAPLGGMFRHTPEKRNENHHDLIKSDQFTIDSIIHHEMIEINV